MLKIENRYISLKKTLKLLSSVIATIVLLSTPSPAQVESKNPYFRVVKGDIKNVGGVVTTIKQSELYTLFPSLKIKNGSAQFPNSAKIEDNKAILYYECGASAILTLNENLIRIEFDFQSSSSKIERYSIATKCSFSGFHNGAYSVGTDGGKLNDERVGVLASSSSSDRFSIFDSNGCGVSFAVQPKVGMRFQDNRKWNWEAYQIFFEQNISDSNCSIEIQISSFESIRK